MFPTGETVGLSEWIINVTCLVYFLFKRPFFFHKEVKQAAVSCVWNQNHFVSIEKKSFNISHDIEWNIIPGLLVFHSNRGDKDFIIVKVWA